jgi:DNA modification methylase
MPEAHGKSRIIVGDALEELRGLDAQSAQSCVTSPPYFGVRDYGVEGEIGAEDSLDDYLHNLVAILSEARRVLRDDGTIFLNIGDSYTSGGRTWRAPDRKNPNRAMSRRPPTPPGLKKKDLIGVPWRLAFALQQPWLTCASCGEREHAMRWGRMPDGDAICPSCQGRGTDDVAQGGLYLRAEVVWERTNAQPESVRDRMSRSHEHVFMLTKAERYLYDNKARRGPNERNLRSVWSIPTQPGRHGHVAPFPEALVEPCVALASRPGDTILDPFLGSGTTAVVACRMGRDCTGIEIDEEAASAAQRRLREAGLA